MPEEPVYTPSQINRELRGILENRFPAIWVRGEISNLRVQASGHSYFTLKDDVSQLSCVLFGTRNRRYGQVKLRDGQQVRAQGRLSIYEARGQYQLIAEQILDEGEGALQARFEELKQRLHAEGLFDADRKQPLPRFPRHVGVVTSPSGAAIRDFLHVLERRAPWVRVLIAPARVQGAGAAQEIAEGIGLLNSYRDGKTGLPLDLIVVTRGGGSLEDLWPFNEEIVARAIAASDLPIISGVGHEIDFTISDFAADYRAPTPSAAAEILAPDRDGLTRMLGERRDSLTRRLTESLDQRRRELNWLAEGTLQREPLRYLGEWQQRIDALNESLDRCTIQSLAQHRDSAETLHQRLQLANPQRLLVERRKESNELARRLQDATRNQLEKAQSRIRETCDILRVLGPQNTLKRGFSMTFGPDGQLVSNPQDVRPGDKIRTRFAEGDLHSTATAPPEKPDGNGLD